MYARPALTVKAARSAGQLSMASLIESVSRRNDFMVLFNERLRSPSRRQKTVIQNRGRPATWVDRLVRRFD
jgi:hypothetical protein